MSIKLTEDQLAGIFQNHSKQHTATSQPGDCLSALPASESRLQHVEDLANDHTAAQATKLAMTLQDWSQIMAQSIENSRRSWFSLLGMNTPLKTSLATVAFAMAVVVAVPEFKQLDTTTQQTLSHDMAHDDIITRLPFHGDVINQVPFDQNGDALMRGGFDASPAPAEHDDLFNGSFG
ncbi:hypothetical protein [Marinicella meishanensis]|uniref:hypothetical protein n=1 Tax=Marinicella meishanensis TaxID=2873263 RepID=UPI001CBE30EE|nr:hypothetical protein [Marinicella sp. NBU2979]